MSSIGRGLKKQWNKILTWHPGFELGSPAYIPLYHRKPLVKSYAKLQLAGKCQLGKTSSNQWNRSAKNDRPTVRMPESSMYGTSCSNLFFVMKAEAGREWSCRRSATWLRALGLYQTKGEILWKIQSKFLYRLKGTVRPDWISLRVVSLDRPYKGHHPFWFFNFDLEYLLVGITVCLESFLPIGWRTLFDEKIRQSSALFWFGLRNDGILYLQAAIQEQLLTLPHFWSRVWRKIGLWPYSPWSQQGGWLEAFLYEAAHNFDLF